MKIPPPCRYYGGNDIGHPLDTIPHPNVFYPPPHRMPPPCHSQYYHPYPPPVPYVFPNYYFYSHRGEPAYLPPQLNEYFRRHPDFIIGRYPDDEEVFKDGGPVRRNEVGRIVIPANTVDEKEKLPKKIADIQILPNNPLKSVHIIHSRILRPLDPANETIKENKKIKKDSSGAQKENVDDADGNDLSMDFSESIEEIPYQEFNIKEENDTTTEPIPPTILKEFDNELEKLLNKALVEYKCPNCTGPSKMLISYPIINRKDNENQDSQPIPMLCSNCSSILQKEKFADYIDGLKSLKTEDILDGCKCKNSSNISSNGTEKEFIQDVDDLVSILIEIIDTSQSFPPLSKPCLPFESFIYPNFPSSFTPNTKISDPSIYTPENRYSKKEISPLAAIINFNLGDYLLNTFRNSLDYPTSPTMNPCKCSDSIPYPYPHIQSSGNECRSDPTTVKVNKFDIHEKLPNEQVQIGYKGYALPETYSSSNSGNLCQENALPKYLKVIPVSEVPRMSILPNINDNIRKSYLPPIKSLPTRIVDHTLQLTNFFIPESNMFIKKENILPEYLQVEKTVHDLDSRKSAFDYCSKCGHKHSGGTYCEKCGYPVISYRKTVQKVVPQKSFDTVPIKDNSDILRDPYFSILGRSSINAEPEYCSKCGQICGDGEYCDACGYPIMSSSKDIKTANSYSLPDISITESDCCTNCGQKHSGGAYCEKCGYQINSSRIPKSKDIPKISSRFAESDYCSKCGSKHNRGSYCDTCGYPINTSMPSNAKDIKAVNSPSTIPDVLSRMAESDYCTNCGQKHTDVCETCGCEIIPKDIPKLKGVTNSDPHTKTSEISTIAESDCCSKCGRKHDGGNYCDTCGSQIKTYLPSNAKDIAVDSHSPIPDILLRIAGSDHCTNCGQKLSGGTCCEKCGHQIIPKISSRIAESDYCSNCGKKHDGGSHCSTCGHPVDPPIFLKTITPINSDTGSDYCTKCDQKHADEDRNDEHHSSCPTCIRETRQLNEW